MQLQLRFLWYILLEHLNVAFKNSILFKIINVLLPDMLRYYRPFKHERLSLLLRKEVTVSSAYFKYLYLSDILECQYNLCLLKRI